MIDCRPSRISHAFPGDMRCAAYPVLGHDRQLRPRELLSPALTRACAAGAGPADSSMTVDARLEQLAEMGVDWPLRIW